ncbi:MAG TPA: TonB-dependent receptor [Steroidobacter sp.]|uniref:TonB-dependent receptor n=1 Tax=Steroidobacter sp. TaxID=1978227 RepID=UPI002EDB266E
MKAKEISSRTGAAFLRVVLAATTGGLALTVTPASLAETAAPDVDSALLEEVVVTAQKRKQTLLEVPQSISVVGGDLLERQHATSFADFAGLAPGLSLQQSNPGESRIILRGINTGGASPTVGIYIDETPFGSSTGLTNGATLAADIDPFDLQRVEVLRGPQGTLYGANSLGGVLRFITAPPVLGKYEVRGQAGVETIEGAGGVGSSVNGVLNVPLGASLAVRASGFYRETPGYIEASGTQRARDINDLSSSGGRFSLLASPFDGLSVRLTALAQNIHSDAGPAFDADPLTLEPVRVDPITGDSIKGLTHVQTLPDEQEVDYRLYNATVDWDLGFANFTSVTSYGETVQQENVDASYENTELGLLGNVTSLLYGVFAGVTDPLGATQTARVNQRKFTQEFRLSSPDSDKLEWLFGAYYTREPGRITLSYVPFDIASHRYIDQTITVGPPLFEQAATFDRFIVANVDSKYREYAAFGSFTWHITPQFEITTGARYSHNNVSTVQTLDGLLSFGTSVLSARSSENISTWSVSPLWEVTDRVSLYARVAKGYRPGGPNVVPPSAPANIPNQFESDTLISYEAGIRGETEDRTFSYDASIYYLDWRNVQVVVTYEDDNLGTIDLDGNGGKARSTGAELTAAWRPTRGLNLLLNAAYNDAQLKDDLPPIGEPPVVPGIDGDQLPFAPKWSASASADYEWNLASNVMAFVGASVRWVSEQKTDFDPAYRAAFGRRLVIDSYETLELRAGVDFNRFILTLYAKNVTDSDGLIDAGEFQTRPGNLVTASRIQPRTIGATLGFSF